MKQNPTFTLPINFFDDDRMIPVSALFGAVGEIVAIRLISMIYSNGYFIELTQLNRCRLLRAIPSLTLETLDEIINCLVSSGLFDADLFNHDGILTSADIQAQYLRANRRRIKPNTALPYFLIPIPEKKSKPAKDAKPAKDEELPAPNPDDTPSLSPEESHPESLDLSDPSDLPESLENIESLESLETPERLETPDNPDNPEPLETPGITSAKPSKSSKAIKLKRLMHRRRKRKHKPRH